MNEFLKRVLDSRSRISTQLHSAIGATVSLTVIAGMVGWISFDRVGDAQSRVNDGSVPALVAAFGVAQQSGTLAAAAPRLAAATTQLELTYTSISIEESRRDFNAQLSALSRAEGSDDDDLERIQEQGQLLNSNISDVENLMWEELVVITERRALRHELEELQAEMIGFLVPAIDDQLFYAMTGYRSLDEEPAPRAVHFSEAELERYRQLAEIHADAVGVFEILATVFNVSSASLIEPLRERFEASASGIAQHMARLPPGTVRSELERFFSEINRLGVGEGGNLDVRKKELELIKQREELLARNQALALELVGNVERLVSAARQSARDATNASEEAILTGRNLLLALSAFSVVGAVLISWLYIGRVLVRRLAWLSERMRRMADGDLEEEIEVRGNDEVADMSSALEVFRRHALEVQRLNLVEKMAEELKGKNEQIEAALAELEKAQDQIVMREKLAALGELTAGVAHEIRNPLNFVKNFAEGTGELLEELMEEVNEIIGEASDDEDEKTRERRDLIRDINKDLVDNVRTIQQHGTRADSIVQSMLMMGRGSGDPQPTDINALVDEHVRLAYHSARATDPNFRLELVLEPDPDVGELQVIPQDLGRVFLNLASNAGYATDEKRKADDAERKANPDKAGQMPVYDPELRVTTRRLEDSIEVRVRDNGNGIPADLVDKIFNPFFTTKPTDKGTGLGLALSNDIVREHGGHIEVDTEPGQYTVMIVHLPLETSTPPRAQDTEPEEESAAAATTDGTASEAASEAADEAGKATEES